MVPLQPDSFRFDNELPEHDPEVGQFVHVGSRRWLVEEVQPGESSIVRLACAEVDLVALGVARCSGMSRSTARS